MLSCFTPSGTMSCVNFTVQELVTGILIDTAQQQKKVYYLSGHKEATLSGVSSELPDDQGFDLALEGVRRDNYRVQTLKLKQVEAVPADAAVLIISGPKQDLDADDTDEDAPLLVQQPLVPRLRPVTLGGRAPHGHQQLSTCGRAERGGCAEHLSPCPRNRR